MKLNLLPKIVDTTGRAKRAFFGGLLVFVISCVAFFLMVSISSARVAKAKASVEEAQPLYQNAVKVANDADAIMTQPAVKQLVVNAALAKAMIKANNLYPDLYDFVKPYIPRFFRITSLAATPIDDKTCSVNMTGAVKDAQEYADLQLALLRIPGASGVSRAGYQKEDMVVPSLEAIDNTGRPRLESKGAIPDDPLDRLTYFENNVDTTGTGFLNSGGFGDTEVGTVKTVRPGESLITVSVIIPRDIQVPDPRQTIQGLAGTGTSTAPTGAPGIPTSAPSGGSSAPKGQGD
ncbi:MAG: hypothetical protein GC165_03710 [Armatimonadetes bacterium]|nr:hypothetical protein [Armatimonadota bacterium]